MAVKEGSKVKIEYTGKLDDGSVFDASEKHGKPLEFEVGKKMVIKGFDEAVIGMEIGQEKDITLKPEDAYGQHNPEFLKKIPRDKLPKEEIKPGMMLMMGLQNGAQVPVKVIDINEQQATLDLNHPLAGKTLHFNIKLVG